MSKAVIYAVLACLLLSWVGSAQWSVRRVHAHDRGRRECHRLLAHLRRCRGGHPNHHPVRPSKSAVLPPDDDDIDATRQLSKASSQRWLTSDLESNPRSLLREFCSRSLPTQVSRHQTLCILLI